MDYRILGRTGVKVSPLALGTDNFSDNPNNMTLTAAQLAILWVKEQPGVTAPLIGVRSMEQFEPLLAVKDMSLDDGLRAACDELVPPGSAVANFHNTADWMKMQISGD